jgi:hypothetical protein
MSGEPKAEMQVEGAPPRDTVVTFTTHHLSYNEGESAAFTVEEAAALVDQGVAVAGLAIAGTRAGPEPEPEPEPEPDTRRRR